MSFPHLGGVLKLGFTSSFVPISDLVAKVQSTLDRVRDISIPESTSNTMAGILEALAVKADGEDPLVSAVRR
jgi:hypothetical protein